MKETRIKQAVLLAAGRGSRLGGLSAEIPKCLVRVGAHRMLDLLLRNLETAGVESLVVVTGYKQEVIHDHLAGVKSPIEFTMVHSPDFATTNNIVSLWRARDAIASDFLLLESDLVLSPRLLTAMSPGNCAAVSPLRGWMNGTVVSVDAKKQIDGLYLGADPKPEKPLFKTINIYGLKWEDWTRVIWPALDTQVQNGNTGLYYEKVFAEKISRGELTLRAAVFDPDSWYEIDTPEDLQQAIGLLPFLGRK